MRCAIAGSLVANTPVPVLTVAPGSTPAPTAIALRGGTGLATSAVRAPQGSGVVIRVLRLRGQENRVADVPPLFTWRPDQALGAQRASLRVLKFWGAGS